MSKNWHKPLKPCLDCGKLISRHATRCHSCAQKHRWNIGAYGLHPLNWKGGRAKHSSGYVVLLDPSHPRTSSAGYVYEHIVVWEHTNGKSLPNGWVIHHLNGIRDDNRPENLLGLPNPTHARLHHLLLKARAKRIQELEAQLK